MRDKLARKKNKLIRSVKKIEDELRKKYDLKTLKVKKMGDNCKNFGNTIIKSEFDVAEVFPDAESVNEAWRFLIRISRENFVSGKERSSEIS